jgi:hypothetical protein
LVETNDGKTRPGQSQRRRFFSRKIVYEKRSNSFKSKKFIAFNNLLENV